MKSHNKIGVRSVTLNQREVITIIGHRVPTNQRPVNAQLYRRAHLEAPDLSFSE